VDDDDSFAGFVAARWTALVTTAYLVTADRGIAEDCVQDALVRLHRRWGRVQPQGRVAYANKAVVNAALSWRRRRRLTEVPLHDRDHDRAVALPDDDDLDPRLLAALWSLPPRTRAAVVLRFLEDRSEVETADLLGCSVGTVKAAASRGLARLRDELSDHDIERIRGGRTT
jgi:RNA polymerase sigma-70 factor (sigma-E family)